MRSQHQYEKAPNCQVKTELLRLGLPRLASSSRVVDPICYLSIGTFVAIPVVLDLHRHMA